MNTCSVDGCSKPFTARGLCGAHYMERRRADPDFSLTRPRGTLEQRFFGKIEKTPYCWNWAGKKRSNGYGAIQAGGRGGPTLSAHRYSYELHKGPIPEGMFVMHACDNPSCVNPDHLSLGTPAENTQDMIRKGRKRTVAPLGIDNGKAKLNEELVRYIRRNTGMSHASLARELGLSPNCIRGVRTRRTWSHVRD